MAEHVQAHPAERFAPTVEVSEALSTRLGALPANVVLGDVRPEAVVLFFAHEVTTSHMQARRHDTARGWFGSFEVNYNYYPGWRGGDRIIASSLEEAAALGIVLVADIGPRAGTGPG
jgi:hypothetical protein